MILARNLLSQNISSATAFTALTNTARYGEDLWLIVSGATEHQTGKEALLIDSSPGGGDKEAFPRNKGREATAS